MDNDDINNILKIQKRAPLTKELLQEEYKDIFIDEVGTLAEEYQI